MIRGFALLNSNGFAKWTCSRHDFGESSAAFSGSRKGTFGQMFLLLRLLSLELGRLLDFDFQNSVIEEGVDLGLVNGHGELDRAEVQWELTDITLGLGLDSDVRMISGKFQLELFLALDAVNNRPKLEFIISFSGFSDGRPDSWGRGRGLICCDFKKSNDRDKPVSKNE